MSCLPVSKADDAVHDEAKTLQVVDRSRCRVRQPAAIAAAGRQDHLVIIVVRVSASPAFTKSSSLIRPLAWRTSGPGPVKV